MRSKSIATIFTFVLACGARTGLVGDERSVDAGSSASGVESGVGGSSTSTWDASAGADAGHFCESYGWNPPLQSTLAAAIAACLRAGCAYCETKDPKGVALEFQCFETGEGARLADGSALCGKP